MSATDKLRAIQKAIESTKEELTATAAEIKQLDQAIVEAVSALKPDEDAIQALEDRRSALRRKLELLEVRIEGLEASIPEARRAVDEEELDRTYKDRAEAHKRAEEALKRWREGVAKLDELVKAAEDVRETVDTLTILTDRARYYELLLDRSEKALPWINFPNEAEIEAAKAKATQVTNLHKWGPISMHRSEWRKRWEELRDKRAREARQRAADAEFTRQAGLRG
ncbi:hypothetical protein J7M00_03480 [bacterium]|nr:hypothetical protein [bacterium]